MTLPRADSPKQICARVKNTLRLILQSAANYAIFTLDMDRKVVDWNAGAEQIFGYHKKEISGQLVDVLFTLEDRNAEPEREMRIAKEQGRAETERWHIRHDGTRFWGSGHTMPLWQEKGKLRGFLKIMLDNTERMQMEEALRQAKEDTERAAQAKEDFLTHMSHEIRTPLNAIIGLADLLLHQNPRPAQLENLQTLMFSGESLKLLVNDILDVSKLKAGESIDGRNPDEPQGAAQQFAEGPPDASGPTRHDPTASSRRTNS